MHFRTTVKILPHSSQIKYFVCLFVYLFNIFYDCAYCWLKFASYMHLAKKFCFQVNVLFCMLWTYVQSLLWEDADGDQSIYKAQTFTCLSCRFPRLYGPVLIPTQKHPLWWLNQTLIKYTLLQHNNIYFH